ncbi:hypothetical protein C4565_04270 [Candidatus Parcubacteria bacterium]|jgi:hypothetical protein|nr:MAG: hypothetical protein C4565_04270 [Candidatus Parcubacteria bacterium]
MNTPTRYFFTFGFFGFIYSLFRIDPIVLFGYEIVYPRILDVLFLAFGGYTFGYIGEQEHDESRSKGEEEDTFGQIILGAVLVIAFIVNIILYTFIPTAIYVYVVCGLIFTFGAWITYIGFQSMLNQHEILYLLMVGSFVGLGFGLVIGGGFLALLYVIPPMMVLGTKQLLFLKK